MIGNTFKPQSAVCCKNFNHDVSSSKELIKLEKLFTLKLITNVKQAKIFKSKINIM